MSKQWQSKLITLTCAFVALVVAGCCDDDNPFDPGVDEQITKVSGYWSQILWDEVERRLENMPGEFYWHFREDGTLLQITDLTPEDDPAMAPQEAFAKWNIDSADPDYLILKTLDDQFL